MLKVGGANNREWNMKVCICIYSHLFIFIRIYSRLFAVGFLVDLVPDSQGWVGQENI
jgi:hypothetical protein